MLSKPLRKQITDQYMKCSQNKQNLNKEEIKSEIVKIQENFGISNAKMGEFMGLSMATYAKNKSDKAEKNSFNQSNLDMLKKSLVEMVGLLK